MVGSYLLLPLSCSHPHRHLPLHQLSRLMMMNCLLVVEVVSVLSPSWKLAQMVHQNSHLQKVLRRRLKGPELVSWQPQPQLFVLQFQLLLPSIKLIIRFRKLRIAKPFASSLIFPFFFALPFLSPFFFHLQFPY